MNANASAAERVLRLPQLDDSGQPGARLIKRAVLWTLLLLASLAGAGLVLTAALSVELTIAARGSLEPAAIEQVRAQEAGVIDDVLVATGDRVRAGQPVLRLQALPLENALLQLEAQRRGAELARQRLAANATLEREQEAQRTRASAARLTAARAALLQRMVDYRIGTDVDSLLVRYRPGSHVALDVAVADVRAAEEEAHSERLSAERRALERLDDERASADLEARAAQIADLRRRLAAMVVTAPTAGVISTEGLEHLRGSLVQKGQALFEVIDPTRWRVALLVSERDLSRLREGDPVKVRVRALGPGGTREMRGKVTHLPVEPAPASVPAPVAAPAIYRVLATLDSTDMTPSELDRIRRGYSVEGRVITGSGRVLVLLLDYLQDKLETRQ